MKMTTLIKMVNAVTSWNDAVIDVRELSKVSVDDVAEGLTKEIRDCLYITLDCNYTDDLIITLDSEHNGIHVFKTVREKYLTKGYSYLSYIYGENKTQIELTAELMHHMNKYIEHCK